MKTNNIGNIVKNFVFFWSGSFYWYSGDEVDLNKHPSECHVGGSMDGELLIYRIKNLYLRDGFK